MISMKVCFLINNLRFGGAERVCVSLCNHWAKTHQVTLVTTYSVATSIDFELDPNISLLHLHETSNGTLNIWQKIKFCRNFFRTEDFDIVVSFLTNVNLINIAASLGSNHKVVVSERTNPFSRQYQMSLRILSYLFYPLADSLVVQTLGLKEQYKKSNRLLSNIEVIPNPLSISNVPWLQKINEPPVHTARKRIVCIGRFEKGKQFIEVLDVFKFLSKKHPGLTFCFIGDGSLRESLHARISDLNMQEKIDVLGFLPQPWEHMDQKEDIFLLPSKFEGFPNALLEAMVMGVTSVAFDCPSGPKDISNQGQCAKLVPDGDFDLLFKELDELLNNPEYCDVLSRDGQAFVVREYCQSRIHKKWDDLFLNLDCN